MGDPLLHEVAQPVTHFDAQLAALVADMDDTMRHLSGAGIAAPQIGVSARVVIFELKDNPRYPHIAPVPYTVLVNPNAHAARRGAGRGLGGMPVGAGHARARAALHTPALSGL